MHRIKKGLNLPLAGEPDQNKIVTKFDVKTVAISGADYVGMKPSLAVAVGDEVKLGQKVFECKKNEGLIFTAPGSGKVVAINRGEKRVFQNLIIELDGTDGDGTQVNFANYHNKQVEDYTSLEVRKLLIESGLFTSIRQRPYSKVADTKGLPQAVFITAMDTNPHAPNPEIFIKEHEDDFKKGILVLSKLTQGKTFVCVARGAKIEVSHHKNISQNIVQEEFAGPHPAGNVGTHIHFLSPVGAHQYVWYVGYQDVVAIGKLFGTGKLFVERLVSLSGPGVREPKLIKTRLGADVTELIKGELKDGENRVITGSVLYGRKIETPLIYLSKFANQISVIAENTHREFLGWHSPGIDRFSVKRTFLSTLLPGKKFDMTTTTYGSKRAMVPVGMFEKIMPLDILPTQLLRALHAKDFDTAQSLGVLELDEEDLALCTFVSPGKEDFGPLLRKALTTIEKEG